MDKTIKKSFAALLLGVAVFACGCTEHKPIETKKHQISLMNQEHYKNRSLSWKEQYQNLIHNVSSYSQYDKEEYFNVFMLASVLYKSDHKTTTDIMLNNIDLKKLEPLTHVARKYFLEKSEGMSSNRAKDKLSTVSRNRDITHTIENFEKIAELLGLSNDPITETIIAYSKANENNKETVFNELEKAEKIIQQTNRYEKIYIDALKKFIKEDGHVKFVPYKIKNSINKFHKETVYSIYKDAVMNNDIDTLHTLLIDCKMPLAKNGDYDPLMFATQKRFRDEISNRTYDFIAREASHSYDIMYPSIRATYEEYKNKSWSTTKSGRRAVYNILNNYVDFDISIGVVHNILDIHSIRNASSRQRD